MKHFKNLQLALILTFVFMFCFSCISSVYALGSISGNVEFELEDGSRVPAPGVRIFRSDKWSSWGIDCGESSCYNDNAGVEVIVDSEGRYRMADYGNNPGPSSAHRKDSDSYVPRCPTGPMNGIDHSLSIPLSEYPLNTNFWKHHSELWDIPGQNWCGLNCGYTAHRFTPYFPNGYQLPQALIDQGYSIEGGSWNPTSRVESPGNNEGMSGRNFVYKLKRTPKIAGFVACIEDGQMYVLRNISVNIYNSSGEVVDTKQPGQNTSFSGDRLIYESKNLPQGSYAARASIPNSVDVMDPNTGQILKTVNKSEIQGMSAVNACSTQTSASLYPGGQEHYTDLSNNCGGSTYRDLVNSNFNGYCSGGNSQTYEVCQVSGGGIKGYFDFVFTKCGMGSSNDPTPTPDTNITPGVTPVTTPGVTPNVTPQVTPNVTPPAGCAESCTSEINSNWAQCSYCQGTHANDPDCLEQEELCRRRTVSNSNTPQSQYPAPIDDMSESARVAWFNWALTKVSCGTACGSGNVCCLPPDTGNPASCSISLNKSSMNLDFSEPADFERVTATVSVLNDTFDGISAQSNNPQVRVSPLNSSANPSTFTVYGDSPVSDASVTFRARTRLGAICTANLNNITVRTPQCPAINMSAENDGIPQDEDSTRISVTTPNDSKIDRVEFSKRSGEGNSSVSPKSDSGSSPYRTTLYRNDTGKGDTRINADVYMNGLSDSICTVSGTYCIANCQLMCGQPDGCGGICPLDTATITDPSDLQVEAHLLAPDAKVSISWLSVSEADEYEVKIYPKDTTLGLPPKTWVVLPSGTARVNFEYDPYSFQGINDLIVEVRATNTKCSTVSDAPIELQTIVSDPLVGEFTLTSEIDLEVTINNDGNNCAAPGIPVDDVTTMDGLAALARRLGIQYTAATLVDNVFTLTVPFQPNAAWNPSLGNFIVRLDIDNSDPARAGGNELFCGPCSGPTGDSSCIAQSGGSADIYSPSGAEVSLMQIPTNIPGWWQVSGGQSYSVAEMVSEIPQTGNASSSLRVPIIPGVSEKLFSAISLPEIDGGSSETAGVPGSNASVDNGHAEDSDFYRLASDQFRIPGGSDHRQSVGSENYEYFSQLVNLDADGLQIVASTITELPTGAPSFSDGTEIYYAQGDLTISPNSTWEIQAGEKIVLFVDGNVTINQGVTTGEEVIKVDTTGFFGIISSGSLSIDSNIGYDHYVSSGTPLEELFGLIPLPTYDTFNKTNASLEGFYLANQLVVESTSFNEADKKFIGAGTFVGLSDLRLERSYEFNPPPSRLVPTSVLNNYSPTETFVYRPDLLVYFPEPLKNRSLIWQEVAN